ncbi:MAG: glutamate synthase, partial [Candidatus Scatosoma sp.]
GKSYTCINEEIAGVTAARIEHCEGQRFLCDGTSGKQIEITGVPGNALGAYLNGTEITVYGNAQDAVGDTMNNGKIVIHGSIGDAAGYAMRGGAIYVEKDAGYRAGIHMKEYGDKKPALVIGGTAGSFLGEYQAGGVIVVLGLTSGEEAEKENGYAGGKRGKTVGYFCGTGMHGGEIYLRTQTPPEDLPLQVRCALASEEDMQKIRGYIEEYCRLFGKDEARVLSSPFYVLRPDSANPYKRLYVMN